MGGTEDCWAIVDGFTVISKVVKANHSQISWLLSQPLAHFLTTGLPSPTPTPALQAVPSDSSTLLGLSFFQLQNKEGWQDFL